MQAMARSVVLGLRFGLGEAFEPDESLSAGCLLASFASSPARAVKVFAVSDWELVGMAAAPKFGPAAAGAFVPAPPARSEEVAA